MTSTIFQRDQAGAIVARQDAKVRIYVGERDIWRTYRGRRQRIGSEPIYELYDLLEFWPDHDYRLKMRGQVWIRPSEKLIERYGDIAAYDEEWMQLRETELHGEDRENLYIHCARKLDGGALVVHKVERL